MKLRGNGGGKSWERDLLDAETALTDPEVRGSRESIEALLHSEFLETGSSGTVYDRETTLRMLLDEAPGEVIVRDFEVRPLSGDTALVTYRSIGLSGQEARRSSVWVKGSDGWQILYHQGTRVPDTWGAVS